MNIHNYLWGGLLAVAVLTSCYKDHSTDASRALSMISEAADSTRLRDQYQGYFGSTFTLSAPNLVQSNEQQELSYRWEVYDPEAGATSSASRLPTYYEGKVLNLPITKYGTYIVRLHASNQDNGYVKQFNVIVESTYSLGLYALVDQNGRPELGYIPASGYDSSRDAETFQLGLQAANPVGAGFNGFSGKPNSFVIFNEYSTTYINLAMDNGGLYTINPGTMQVSANITNIDTLAQTNLYTSGAGGYSGVNGLIRGGKYFTRMTSGGVYMRMSRQWQQVLLDHPSTLLAQRAAYVNSSIATFDYVNSSVLFFPRSGYTRFEGTSTSLGNAANYSQWRGSTLVDMTAYDNQTRLALLLKTTAGAYRIARLQPTAGSNPTPVATFLGMINVPTALGVTDNSRLISGEGDLLYIANAKNIYAYIASSTAFLETPLVTLSGDESITDLFIRVADGERRLYVASSNGTTSTISCYNLNENSSQATLLWSKSGISGKVIQLAYRATR